MPIRIVAAEDSFLAREGIVSILGDIEDVELVEMSGDLDELVSARQQDDSELTKLTPRELEILALIAEGRSNASIASSLGITKRAVERHINAIFLKLDLGEPEDVSRRVKAALLYLGGDAL